MPSLRVEILPATRWDRSVTESRLLGSICCSLAHWTGSYRSFAAGNLVQRSRGELSVVHKEAVLIADLNSSGSLHENLLQFHVQVHVAPRADVHLVFPILESVLL